MAPLDNIAPGSIFSSFDVYRTSYKKINNQSIDVAILIPKNLKPGKHPLLVKFHGGSLVTGDCLYPDWFSPYWIPFIQRNNAITILPNYRLLPESTGADILEDLADFWKWFHGDGLTSYLASQNVQAELDFAHLLVSGESAGGFMALQSALTQPKGSIRAVLVQYPMVDVLKQVWQEEFFGFKSPQESIIDEHMAAVTPGTIVSGAHPPQRMLLAYALAAFDRYTGFFGEDKYLWPLYAVEKADYLPPTWILHAEQDSVVSVENSRAFVEKVKKVLPDAEIGLEVAEGDHGFDGAATEDEVEWLRRWLKWSEDKWLA